MEIIISVLVFLSLVLGAAGISLMRGEQKRAIDQRLDNLTKTGNATDEDAPRARELDWNRILSRMGKNFSKLSFSSKLEDDLDKADILLRIDEFIGLVIIISLSGAALGLLLTGNWINTLIGALLGALLPVIYVKHKRAQRAALLSEEIGESLTGMSNSLRAGHSFQQAMAAVSRETQGPLGKEYRRTLREINLGVTTEQALQNLVNRVDNEDLELMISAVLIQRSVGGNLAEMFDKIAETIRQRIRMKGEVRVLTAQGRASAWIIGLMPVAMIVIISMLNPGYMGFFFESTTGLILLVGAAVSEVIGFLLIKKIANIEM